MGSMYGSKEDEDVVEVDVCEMRLFKGCEFEDVDDPPIEGLEKAAAAAAA